MKSILIINRVFAICFILLGALAIYGSVMLGATHHLGTAAVSIIVAIVMLRADRAKHLQ